VEILRRCGKISARADTEAEAVFSEAIARDPGNSMPRNARGVMFAAMARHLDAVWCYSIQARVSSAHLIFALAASLIVASPPWLSSAHAEPPDPLGSIDSFHFPASAPSIDPTPRDFVMNGQRYHIPRNYIEALEKENDGSAGVISMRALLPDLAGLTAETIKCLDYRNTCSEQVVTIGLTHLEYTVPGSRMVENIKRFALPDKFVGPCGLEFYEKKGNEGQRFRYFVKKLNGNADVSVLRCAKEGASYAPHCVANYNTGDGNHFYYIFHRKYLCGWQSITDKILGRIASFRAGVAR
jgi:hypothetical protein